MGSKLLIKYYRLSLEDSKQRESESIANQRRQVEDYVEHHEDLREMDCMELVDDGYTGTNFKRPGISRFFALLKNNQVGCLVIKDFSRFSRDYIEMGNYIEQVFPLMDVRVISINDEYDSARDMGENSLEIAFKGILNDLYSKDISSKVKAAKQQMMKQGKLCGGDHPFGYVKSRNTEAVYSIDEDAAKIIRYIFKLALEGKENYTIARILNAEQYPTPAMYRRGKGEYAYGLQKGACIWNAAKVLRILRDERYKGTLILGRYQSAGVGERRVEIPKELWIRKENAIPKIISEQDFDAVQILHPCRFYSPISH